MSILQPRGKEPPGFAGRFAELLPEEPVGPETREAARLWIEVCKRGGVLQAVL
jgi:hypothetical protein